MGRSPDSPDGCPSPRLIQPPRRDRASRRRAPFLKACNRDECPKCGPLRRGDFLRVIGEAMKLAPVSAICTLTPPGDDVLPRNEHGICLTGPLQAWNATDADRWHLMMDALQRLVVATTGTRAALVAWTRELQERGALHRHFVLDLATPELAHAARVLLYLMKTRGADYGFGFVDVGGKPWDGRRERVPRLQGRDLARRAGYLAKYMSKGRPEIAQAGGTGLRGYVHRRRTMITNVTRGSLQRRRMLWRLEQQARGAIPTGVLVIAIAQTFGPIAGYPRDVGLPPGPPG